MASLREALAEKFTSDGKEEDEQGVIPIEEPSTDEENSESQKAEQEQEQELDEPEDVEQNEEEDLQNLLQEAAELIKVQNDELFDLRAQIGMMEFEKLSQPEIIENKTDKEKRIRPGSLGKDLHMTIGDGIKLMGVSLLWLVVLIGADKVVGIYGLMAGGVLPTDLLTWSIGSCLWCIHLLYILNKTETILSFGLGFRIQTSIAVGLAVGTAILLTRKETATVTNVWTYGSIFAFIVLLFSGFGGAFVRAYTRKFRPDSELEDPRVITSVEKKNVDKKALMSLTAGLIVFILIASVSASTLTEYLSPAKDCDGGVSGRMMADGDCPHRLNIASWNLQVFGQSKANDNTKIATIANVIRDYDVVAIQEIKDAQMTAPYFLQDELEKHSEFGMLLSNRTGASCQSTGVEQFAFYYNVETIKALDSGSSYPNNDCAFTREPFAARFQSLEFDSDFVLITAHLKPDYAISEMQSLPEVLEWARFQYPDEDDFIILGDLNADCDYASQSQLASLELRNGNYDWIIPDNASTNTAEASSCAYDRIIIPSGEVEEHIEGYNIDCEVSSVSDHCIISTKISAHEA